MAMKFLAFKPSSGASRPDRSQPDRFRSARLYLGRTLLVLGPVLLLILAVWFYRYLTQPVPVFFRAAIQTRSLSFTLGHWPDSAGIFNSDIARVDLSLLTPTTLLSDQNVTVNCARGTRFANVALLSTATSDQLHVALDVESDGALRYSLTPATSTSEPLASVSVGDNSDVNGLACDSPQPALPSGEWQIAPSSPGEPLEFLVHFLPGPSTASPAPERDIPLLDATNVLFQGESGLSGTGNEVHLLDTNRTLGIAEGLTLLGTRSVSIQSLAYDRASQALVTTVAGATDNVAVKVGRDRIDNTETVASTKHIGRFAGWFSGLASLACAVATIVGARMTAHDKQQS